MQSVSQDEFSRAKQYGVTNQLERSIWSRLSFLLKQTKLSKKYLTKSARLSEEAVICSGSQYVINV